MQQAHHRRFWGGRAHAVGDDVLNISDASKDAIEVDVPGVACLRLLASQSPLMLRYLLRRVPVQVACICDEAETSVRRGEQQ